ncbi:MAG: ADP-ribosylglycohydrolase family protein [Planctomycetota bacterium]
MRERILGAIYGHLVGDAFGVPYEFEAAADLPAELKWRGFGTHHQPPGTWSDDGALMLCLLASLHECGRFDPADAGRRFVRWRDAGYLAAGGVVFDVGITTGDALNRLRAGVPPLEAGAADEAAGSNGSLMRILPLPLWARHEPPARLVAICHDGSRLTHGHTCPQVCCAVYGLLVQRLLTEHTTPADAWGAALATAEAEYCRNPAWGNNFAREVALIRQFRRFTGGGFVVDCLCSAWAAVRRADDYADAVRQAVRFGNDTDTTAAVAGSLAGLIFGVDGIPADWLSELRLTDDQGRLIAEFADRCAPGV